MLHDNMKLLYLRLNEKVGIFNFIELLLFQIESGEVEKKYIAKVIGVFPENEVCSCTSIVM